MFGRRNDKETESQSNEGMTELNEQDLEQVSGAHGHHHHHHHHHHHGDHHEHRHHHYCCYCNDYYRYED